MAGLARRWRLASLLIVAGLLATGCSLPSLAYFVMTGFQEPKEDAGDMKLASAGGREVKVVILAHCPLERGPELIEADRDLTGLLTRALQQSCKENKDKVVFVPHGKVQEYKNNHPHWFLKVEEVGKHFDADKVIFLEIQGISLYERGSANQLYRGRTTIAVRLYDLRHPDDYRVEKTYSSEFPSTRGPISVDDKKPREFYLEFLNHVVKQLSWYFTAHPVSDDITCD